jgi:hypothetical protein
MGVNDGELEGKATLEVSEEVTNELEVSGELKNELESSEEGTTDVVKEVNVAAKVIEDDTSMVLLVSIPGLDVLTDAEVLEAAPAVPAAGFRSWMYPNMPVSLSPHLSSGYPGHPLEQRLVSSLTAGM